MLAILGIDPGLTGAMTLLAPDCIECVDTPTLTVAGNGKKRNEYDTFAIRYWLTWHQRWAKQAGYEYIIAIERQQAMPAMLHGRTQGTVSSFRTGYGYGLWLGMIAALELPCEVVAPVSWKRAIMADSPKDKSASLLVAKRLFPQAADLLKRKKDHARADALLIAEFVRRRRSGVAATEGR